MEHKKKHWRITILMLFCVLILTVILSVSIGAVKVEFFTVVKIIAGWGQSGSAADTLKTIILKVRLPRVLAAGMVGFALATSGTIFQGLLKNPMADPYVLGLSSGASVGAILGMIINIDIPYVSSIPLFAFTGAVLTAFIVYNLARKGGKVPVATLLLAGIAVSSFLSAIVSLLMFFNDDSMHQIIYWMMGSLASTGWGQVKMSWLYVLIGFMVPCLLARELNLILMGEETAQSLGVEIEKVKKILLVFGSLLAGVAVAVSGIIGFVGLIIPHIVRLLVGPDHRILIPASALGGAIFLVWADTLARTALAPAELPVGIITALFGAPFFLYLLRKNRRQL